MFGLKQKPLLEIGIIHALPGRIRIGCRALRYLNEQASEVRERLVGREGIQSVRVSRITANILIHYDPEKAEPERILETVESVIGIYATVAYKAEREEQAAVTINERRLQEEPIGDMVNRVITTTVTLLFYWLRRGPVTPPASYVRRFLTIPALTTLSLAFPIFRSGWESLRRTGRPNADTLSATAIFTSLLAGRDLSSLTIIWLADIAELLTAYTMDRTRRAIRDMLETGEDHVWVLREDNTEVRRPLEKVVVGDRLVVHSGEKISVDGSIEDGEAAVNQASITGEFMPTRKIVGDEVFAGSLVKTGAITVRAEKVGDQTAVARIVHMVEEASHRKASIQSFADKFSAGFIPVNFIFAALVYAITKSSTRALNMLIIDYSCGVRLSTATALSAAICSSARQGILIKGGNYIEMLADTDTLIFDKTGTVTEGRPLVTSIYPTAKGIEPRKVVELAGAAEETSTHPMAAAVMEKIRKSGWRVPRHTKSKIHVARGAEAGVNKKTIRVGNRRFMEESGIDVSATQDKVSTLVRRGENVLYVARDREMIGVLGVQDTLRTNMKKSLNRLRNAGMDDIILLTGDVEQHAEIVATHMAMDRFEAEVLPEDKAETVLRLQSRGVRVAMVGDGVNDAPALAYADVGIAMGGTRTDIAMETSDMTIASDDPLLIPGIVRLSRKTMKIVHQNFATAIGVNTLGLMLSSIGVLPVIWGAVLHNACTVAVVLNSAQLLFHDVERGR